MQSMAQICAMGTILFFLQWWTVFFFPVVTEMISVVCGCMSWRFRKRSLKSDNKGAVQIRNSHSLVINSTSCKSDLQMPRVLRRYLVPGMVYCNTYWDEYHYTNTWYTIPHSHFFFTFLRFFVYIPPWHRASLRLSLSMELC